MTGATASPGHPAGPVPQPALEDDGTPSWTPDADDRSPQVTGTEAGNFDDTESSDEAQTSPDPGDRLRDPERLRQAADFCSFLLNALAQFEAGSPVPLSGHQVTLSGNIFLGDATLQDAVAGSKYGGTPGNAFPQWLPSGLIADSVLQEIRATFVAPGGYQILDHQIRQNHLLLLRAAAGWGRTASALHLLEELCPAGVWKLNPEVRLDSLKTSELKAGSGYLVECLEYEQAARLRPFHLETLSWGLQESSCRLVVTLDETAPVPENLRGEWVHDGGPPADPVAVVHRHLAWRIQGAANGSADFLRQPDVQALIQEVTSGTLSARGLAGFAASLAEAATGRANLADLRKQFSTEWAESFQQWFDGQRDTGQRAFVIALAVLNGMHAQTVTRAADRLSRTIHASAAPETSVPRPVFGVSRDTRLEEAHAELFTTTQDTLYGQTAGLGLRFQDDRYAKLVLERLWAQYEDARPLIIDWLRDLGADTDHQVQVRAGMAAGLLSLFDFDTIQRELLAPWASSSHPREREAAVGALTLPSRDLQLAPLVSRMLADWRQPHRPVPMRWTAARALGAAVGTTMVGRAMRLLALVADSGNAMLTAAVCDSVIELFAEASSHNAGVILDALLRWAAASEQSRRHAAVLCFLQIGHDLAVEVPPGALPGPALLWLAQQDEKRFTQIVTMLCHALDTPHLFSLGYEVLHTWLLAAERDSRLREPLCRIVIQLAANTYVAENLGYYLNLWSEDTNAPAATITALQATLTEREHR